MITLKNITLRRGPHVLLDDINWTIYHKQHIGIIGANGCGKSSLLSLLRGELQADVGTLDLPRQIKMAHVAQETPALAQSALEFVLDGDIELRQLQAELLLAEEQDNGEHIAELHHYLSDIDAYTAPSRAAQLLAGLGFVHSEHQQPVSAFSGGWRVRLNLAKALIARSDILLLDEPTNHLDLDAVLWLAGWLKKYPGTLLLISHDRDFLDDVVDHIAHIHSQQLKLYAGNYSVFEKQRAADLLVQQAAFEKQQKRIAHLQSFVDRFRAKATKAAQAQSRLKAIEKMDLVSAVQADSPLQFHFRAPASCPNPLITIDDARIAYGEKEVVNHINFQITPKDRIALLGPNGAGKSSFIKLLAGEVNTSQGVFTTSAGVKIGYFAQHQVDQLHLSETPLYHLKQLAPDKKEQELRTYLGSFDFGDRALEPITHFSGGEKSRLALALLIWQRPNLLLLDEPTNHLDLDMRQALSLALQEYEGAMVLVSHDRFLVRTTVDQLVLVANGQLHPFDGDLDSYERWLTEFRRQEVSSATKNTSSRKATRQQQADQRSQRRPLLQQIKKQEEELARLQKKLTDIELMLADGALYEETNKPALQEWLQQQVVLKKAIETTENAWLAATEALDNHDNTQH